MYGIERIMRKYFSQSELEYLTLAHKCDNPAWLDRNGYAEYRRNKMSNGGYFSGYVLNKRGKAFVEKSEKRINVLLDQIEISSEQLISARDEIYKYLKRHKDYNPLRELSDDMHCAYIEICRY